MVDYRLVMLKKIAKRWDWGPFTQGDALGFDCVWR